MYVADRHASVPRPPKELKGFVKVLLKPGETKRVSVPLDVRSLSYYDEAGHQWRADAGNFELHIGGSSADTTLNGRLTLAKMITTP